MKLTFWIMKLVDGHFAGRWVRLTVPNRTISGEVGWQSQAAYRPYINAPLVPPYQPSRIPSVRRNPTFFFRFEAFDRIIDIETNAAELTHGSLDDVDSVFWRGFTPNAYQLVQAGFRLRLWRRPRWIVKEIRHRDGEKAEAMWGEIFNLIIDGDVLWLEALLPPDQRVVT
jgi:hypothetical protein